MKPKNVNQSKVYVWSEKNLKKKEKYCCGGWWTGLLLAECKSQNTKDNKQSNNHCVVITIGVDSKNRYYYNR